MSASSLPSTVEADFPAHSSPRQRLSFALQYAALAPTESYWQPWEFHLADTHLELFAKPDRTLESVDPDQRELLIGCGAALQYLKQALKHFGCLGRVELFPDLDQPNLVARIHFGFCRERDEQERQLFAAMANRRAATSLGETPVSEATLAALNQAVAAERGWLEFTQNETSRQRVVEIASAAESRLRPANPVVGGQTSRWSRPLFAFGGRNLDAQNLAVEPPRPVSIPAATFAVVKTKTDDKHGWLAAGQTLARAVLQAQALGLSWAFFNQVRSREAREALRMGIGHKGFAQVILRFGALMSGESLQPIAPTTATATFR